LKSPGFFVVPHDKDSGLTILTRDDLMQVHASIASSNIYGEIAYSTADNETQWAIQRYIQVFFHAIETATSICGISGMICKSLRRPGARLFGELHTTCKTHKSPGDVSHRPIHASPTYSFAGLALWVVYMLRRQLADKAYSHIIKDTTQFVREVSKVKMKENYYYFKLDIKDFFERNRR
jgi:hypothetical protein